MMSNKEINIVIEEPTVPNGDGDRRKSSMGNLNPGSTVPVVEIDDGIQKDLSNPEFRLRKPGKPRGRACRPVHPAFDPRRYVEIVVTFNTLKNFDLKEVPRPGQYVIRASVMGKAYGYFISKSVDIHAIALYARADLNDPHCPDIDIDEELFFYIRFKELIDNPILLSLCDTTGRTTTEYENLSPIAYICLDIAQILNIESSMVETHIEPWVIIDPEIQKTFLSAQPMLKLSIECISGMPTPIQLRQGNIMTVFVESMSHLPEEVVQNTSDPKDNAETQVMLTLPHSDKEPFLDFSGGRLNDGSFMFIEPPLTTLPTLDEATQTGDLTNPMDQSGRFAPTRHWASVRNHWKDLPIKAAAASTSITPEMEDATTEVFGDAVEEYASMGSRQEPLISWDTQHKKYIPMESYKNMLTRLSQDVIWPLEVIVTTQRPSTKKDKPKISQSEKPLKKKKKKQKISDESAENEPSEVTSNEAIEAEHSDILYMNSLDRPTTSETVIVYHGIAFVDLSRLVYPGVQKVRFACKLHPFSQELLMSKTCLTKSAFADTLQGVSSLTAYESSLNLGNPKNKSEPFLESSETEEFNLEDQAKSSEIFPFIVFEISLKRAIIPLYKTPSDVHETVQDYIPQREIPRRKVITAGIANQNFRRAVLEAAAEVSAEYTNHYWKDVVQGNKDGQGSSAAISADELKKGFVFYLNASGRYLILREHLRQAVSQIVQQRCLNLRPSGFQTHRDFQSYLHDMYTYLVDEIHETLSRTALQEVDPLDGMPARPKGKCSPEAADVHFKEQEQKTTLRELLFYAEESLAQGDFDNCHRLHLQRICRSKENPQCWVDFAIMWLSRGDDRMAEIAVREALRSDPKNIHALTIAGVIAVRHNDERGIDCISSALGLKPLSPEILVILAVSLATVNNEMGSDFFFRKAAHIHRTLTGQETGDLDKIFDNISKSVGVKQSVMDIAKAEVEVDKPVTAVEDLGINETLVNDQNSVAHESVSHKLAPPKHSHHPRKSSTGRKSSDPNTKKGSDPHVKNGSDSHVRNGSDPHAKRHSQSRKLSTNVKGHNPRRSSHKNDSNENHADEIAEEVLDYEPQEEEDDEEEELYTKRDSISGKSPRKSSLYKSKFDFETDLSNITAEDALLPPLRPSLLVPWNVTEFTDKKKVFLEAADNIPGPHTGSGESEIASDEIIKAEYDKIVNNEDGENPDQAEIVGVGTPESPIIVEGTKRKSVELPKKIGSEVKEIVPSKTEQKLDRKNEDKSIPTLPVYTNRLGSELIWTAQLLLQMRMFDMLDGVLARELYVSGSRSIEFLYLRAMSLYFRQSQHEAIPVLDEAIELDSENPVFWIIKGHCHYEIGQNSEATTCYEKALRLPVGKENRHLLYLRYGSLSMDGVNSESAKKVFLHGIQKYPTPYMWLATGNTCYAMGEFDEAEASFTEANRLDNTNPITWAHLALINLAKDQQALAEQSYKWALRFGLKQGKIMDEIKRLQDEKGFGDPSFPRVPNCIPHDYYVKRLGRQRPFDIYRDALINEPPTTGKTRFDDNARETEMKQRLKVAAECGKPTQPSDEPAPETDIENAAEVVEQNQTETEPTENVAPTEEPELPPASEDNSKQPIRVSKSVLNTKQGKSHVTSTAKQSKGKKSIDRSESKPKNRRQKNLTSATGRIVASILPLAKDSSIKKSQKKPDVLMN